MLKRHPYLQVWQTWRLDMAMWNCIAAYHPTALNALTKAPPVHRAPVKYHTSEARALCMFHAVNKLMPELIPISAGIISEWLEDMGLDPVPLTNEEAREMAAAGDITPRVMGGVVAADILDDMATDGFNHLGKETSTGPCEANCRPFLDTTGYTPVNSPWEISAQFPYRWQPLIESNDLGFFYAQEHVTPHIGEKAKPAVLTRTEIDARTLDDPEVR